MLQFLTHSVWADRIGWMLVHSLWQFTLVALAAIILRRALQRCSAATRYGALLTAMIIMVAAPVATWLSPLSSPRSAEAPSVAVNSDPVENLHNVPPLQPEDDMMPMADWPAALAVEFREKQPTESAHLQPAPRASPPSA